jgi:hypothetical protein
MHGIMNYSSIVYSEIHSMSTDAYSRSRRLIIYKNKPVFYDVFF